MNTDFYHSVAPSREDWDKVCANSNSANILNSWEYGEVLQSIGNGVMRLIIFSQGQPVAVMLGKYVSFLGFSRSLVLGRHGGGSPVMIDGLSAEQKIQILHYSLNVVEKEARKRRIFHTIFHPPFGDEYLWDEYLLKGYQLTNYLYTPIHIIPNNSDDLWNNLHQKHRNNIRNAVKKQIYIKREDNIDAFLQLKQKHQKLKDYNDTPVEDIRRLYSIFNKHGMCSLYFVEYENQYIAAALILHYQDTLYFIYGASTVKSWKLVGGNNLLHWQIMKDGQERGYKKYNMWGITSPNGEDNPSRFKTRFSKNVFIITIPVFKKYVYF